MKTIVRSQRILCWVVGLALAALACLPARAAEGVNPRSERPPYRITIGDALEVVVWKNPDVSRRVAVRPDGRITLPLAGEVYAEGMTLEELRATLADRLKEFIQDPIVTVSLEMAPFAPPALRQPDVALPPTPVPERTWKVPPLYRIGLGDVLEVVVWKNPDASRVAVVRPDGRISLPLVGDILAEGLTTEALSQLLTERLRRYFADPVVTVSVQESRDLGPPRPLEPVTSQPKADEGSQAEYGLGVEDVLDVSVWKNPELTKQVWVRPDGRITLPLVGDFYVLGKSTQAVAEAITARLKTYLPDPVVTVSLNDINSYQVYVLGKVMKPGPVKLRGVKTAMQVLSLAGGFAEFADADEVVIVRTEQGKEQRIAVDVDGVVGDGAGDPLVRPGDVVVVPAAGEWSGRGLASFVGRLGELARDRPGFEAFERAEPGRAGVLETGARPTDVGGVAPGGARHAWRARLLSEAIYSDNVEKDEQRDDGFWALAGFDLGWASRVPGLEGAVDYAYKAPIYQTPAVEQRDAEIQIGSAAVRWRPEENLMLQGSGTLERNVEASGSGQDPQGVTESYANRQDYYTANGKLAWQPTGTVSAQGDYFLRYRNYVSYEAEGQDTRNQGASGTVAWTLAPADTLSLAPSWNLSQELQEDQDPRRERSLHGATTAWEHRFRTWGGGRADAARLSYAVERGVGNEMYDYWSHEGSLGWSGWVGARTQYGLAGGYKWIRSTGTDDQEDQGGLTGSANLTQSFSERLKVELGASRTVQYLADSDDVESSWDYRGSLFWRLAQFTELTVTAGQAWEYRPLSTRTDFSVLTRTRSVRASLTRLLDSRTRFGVDGGYENGDRSVEGDYWFADGRLSFSVRSGLKSEWGGDGSALRHQGDEEDGDYWLTRASAFYRWVPADWLSLTLRYAYERREDDEYVAHDESYRENRVTASLSTGW